MYNDNGMPMADEDSWVHIYPSMVNELHLTGSELVTYAVVYSFEAEDEYSKDGWFFGTQFDHPVQIVAAWCGTSVSTARHNLGRLMGKGLLESNIVFPNGVRRSVYRTTEY